MSRIENGSRAPTLETVEKLARGLGVSVVELLEPIRPEQTASAFPPRVLRLARALSGADEDLQRAAEGMVKLLLATARLPRRRR